MISVQEKRCIAILYSPSVEAIVDGYMDLVAKLPQPKWRIVLPLASREDKRLISTDLFEPDWYAWKKRPIRIFRMIRFLYRLRDIVRRERIKNAFLYGAPSPWHWLTRLVLPRLDWTVYVHDPTPHDGERLKRLIFFRLEERFILQGARSLIVSYAGAIPILRNRIGSRCPPIEMAPLPLPSDYQSSAATPVSYDVLFFGRLEAYKGLDMLDGVLESLSRHHSALRIAIIGRGPLLDYAKSLVRKHPGSVLQTAYLSKRDVALHIQKSRMVLLPYHEATGTQLIQIANSLGRPVVCTDVGCFPEYVKQGINGFVVPREDHESFARRISEILISTPEEWESRCREHARQYASMDEFAADIDRIVSNDGRRTGRKIGGPAA